MAKKHRKNESRGFFTVLFEEYRFELTVTLLFSLGMFLLLEKMEIKRFVWSGVRTAAKYVAESITHLLTSIVSIIRSVETSDIAGLILILIAGILVLNRIRIRTIGRMSLPNECPKCGGSFQRIHRTISHRILEIIMFAEIKHYRCKKCSYKQISATQKKKIKTTHH